MVDTQSRISEQQLAALIAERKPGWTMPRPFYTDENIFRLDIERIWKLFWLYAGHTSQIPKVGDYFTWTVADDSVIIVRGNDGQVHALYNTCRHRGSVVCNKPSGNAKKLVCPYHQWVYDLDGTLKATRLMPKELDKSQFGLHRCQVRVCEGLIFISLSDDPPPFEPFERDIKPYMLPYQMEKTKICHTMELDVHANWKAIAENFRECYHCGGGHPEYSRTILGSHLDRAEYMGDRQEIIQEREEHWGKLGLKTGHVDFTAESWHHCVRLPFRPGFVCESLDGKLVAPLLGTLTEADAGALAIVTLPNFWHESSSDYFMTTRHTPISATLCRTRIDWFVREDAVEGRDYDLKNVTAFWTATLEQDWKLCVDNQAGLMSSRYQPGPLGPKEDQVEIAIQWYLKQVAIVPKQNKKAECTAHR